MPAPIALFTFNRPWHTKQTIDALKKNLLADLSDLIVFSDGPRSIKDQEKISLVREYLPTITGFKSITIIESPTNKGLANSITSGVSSILEKYDSIIVVEDDLETSPYFLSFMNQSLDLYKDEPNVISINGYLYPIQSDTPQTFFLKGADCQGWATWKRGWSFFNPDGRYLLNEIKRRKLTKEFNYENSYPYLRMLYYQQKGMVDSWAIRWYASAFLQEKLTLYPSVSLLQNIGFDNTGTNSSNWDKKRYETRIQEHPIDVIKIKVEQNVQARKAFGNYFLKTRKPLYLKIRDKVVSILNRFNFG